MCWAGLGGRPCVQARGFEAAKWATKIVRDKQYYVFIMKYDL